MSIFFWREYSSYGQFSNFYEEAVVIDGKSWPTVEHYFQAMKTLDLKEQESIRLAKTPLASKKMGRKVKLRADWEEIKIEVMKKALREKFKSPKLRSLLLSTKNQEIYEDSPFDKIWGTGKVGSVGTGLNLLGKCLMEIRSEIKSKQKSLIFIGPPGCGKGTQAKKLTGFNHLSTGDLLREEVAKGSALGVEIKKIIDEGNFVSDDLSLSLVMNNMVEGEKYIIDGFPRTLSQAKLLSEKVDMKKFLVFFFDVSLDKLKERLVNRRSCPNCGEIFNLKTSPPKKEDVCDKCSHQGLVHRSDDMEERIESRFKNYTNLTAPLKQFYTDAIKLNADIDTDDLHGQIEKFLKE